jgi:xylulokinase
MRGGFLHVGLDTSRSDLARAVLEGVALNLRWLQGPVEKFIDRTISHYVFYGGGARSDLWSGVMADVLGRPVHQLADAGFANSIGTAIFGFDRLGIASASDLTDRPRINAVYEPDPANRALYDDLAGIFADSFKRIRPLSHRLGKRR